MTAYYSREVKARSVDVFDHEVNMENLLFFHPSVPNVDEFRFLPLSSPVSINLTDGSSKVMELQGDALLILSTYLCSASKEILVIIRYSGLANQKYGAKIQISQQEKPFKMFFYDRRPLSSANDNSLSLEDFYLVVSTIEHSNADDSNVSILKFNFGELSFTKLSNSEFLSPKLIGQMKPQKLDATLVADKLSTSAEPKLLINSARGILWVQDDSTAISQVTVVDLEGEVSDEDTEAGDEENEDDEENEN